MVKAMLSPPQIIGHEVLRSWDEEFGKFVVYADANERYACRELKESGFEVMPVPFGMYKADVIANVKVKWFIEGRRWL